MDVFFRFELNESSKCIKMVWGKQFFFGTHYSVRLRNWTKYEIKSVAQQMCGEVYKVWEIEILKDFIILFRSLFTDLKLFVFNKIFYIATYYY